MAGASSKTRRSSTGAAFLSASEKVLTWPRRRDELPSRPDAETGTGPAILDENSSLLMPLRRTGSAMRDIVPAVKMQMRYNLEHARARAQAS